MSLLNAIGFLVWYSPLLVFMFILTLTLPIVLAVGFFFSSLVADYCEAALTFIERKEDEIARARERLSRKEPPDVSD